MTLLVSWIGVDNKKEGKSVASVYIASDSRYKWKAGGIYNMGIKVFGSTRYPDIFGFCGDVQFPSTVLLQLITQIDSDLIIHDTDEADAKNKKVLAYIATSLESYPKEELVGGFTIFHATRVRKEFSCFKTSYSISKGLENDTIDLAKTESTNIFMGGSGKKDFKRNWRNWEDKKHNNYGTSRAVYHCLVQTLKETKDPGTGGLPQIIGLYRIGNARVFGIVEEDKMYIHGKKILEGLDSLKIEWRNENFERVNPETMKLFDGAQRQPS
jgi:hypothetical protein